jgi:ElaA protein
MTRNSQAFVVELGRAPEPCDGRRMRWVLRRYDALALDELYGVLALRQRVFIVEQKCAFLDADGRDRDALHVFATDDQGRIIACLRVVPPGGKFAEPSLGRIVTAPEVRGEGLGRAIVARGIEATIEAYGDVAIRISAQRHLERFYGAFGFVAVGDPYLEDDIPHLDMLRPSTRR